MVIDERCREPFAQTAAIEEVEDFHGARGIDECRRADRYPPSSQRVDEVGEMRDKWH